MSGKTISFKYQYKFNEIPIDLSRFTYNPPLPPNLTQLDEEVMITMINIARQNLTEKQLFVFDLLYSDEPPTQMEILKMVHARTGNTGKSNSTIYHQIRGSPSYVNGKIVSTDGGIAKKMKRHCLQSNQLRLQLLHLQSLMDNLINNDVLPSSLALAQSWFGNLTDYLDWLETPLHPSGYPQWQVDALLSKQPTGLKDSQLTRLKIALNFPIPKYTFPTVRRPLSDYKINSQTTISRQKAIHILKRKLNVKELIEKYKLTKSQVDYIRRRYYLDEEKK